MYRKTLGAPPEAGIEEEMEIPETMTLPMTIEAGENVTLDGLNVTAVVVPVREEFYKSIVQQQILFGNVTEIVDSKMVPRGSANECRVSVSGYASLQIVNVTKVGSDEMWEIAVGPMDYKATGMAAGFVSIKIALMQQMLESLAGEQIYEYSWSTKIQLPVDATLLNGDELEGLNWTIDFGGGTYMNASVSLDGTSTIILDERTVVTEGNITLTPEYLYEAFSGYKAFEIGYLLPYSGEGCESKKAGGIDDFSFDWSVTIAPGTLPVEFTYTPTPGVTLSASLEVTPSLTISGHIAWDIGVIWKYKHTWPCIKWWYFIIATKKFEAWMDLSASIKVGLTASATASVSKTWQIDLVILIV